MTNAAKSHTLELTEAQRDIVARLHQEPMTAQELTDCVDFGHSWVKQSLRVLIDDGLVRCRRCVGDVSKFVYWAPKDLA